MDFFATFLELSDTFPGLHQQTEPAQVSSCSPTHVASHNMTWSGHTQAEIPHNSPLICCPRLKAQEKLASTAWVENIFGTHWPQGQEWTPMFSSNIKVTRVKWTSLFFSKCYFSCGSFVLVLSMKTSGLPTPGGEWVLAPSEGV